MSDNNIKKVILSWLNDKENYINIDCTQGGSAFNHSMQNDIIKNLIKSAIATERLSATKLYLVKNELKEGKEVITEKIFTPKNRQNFLNFTLPLIKYATGLGSLISFKEKFDNQNTEENKYLLRLPMEAFEDELENKKEKPYFRNLFKTDNSDPQKIIEILKNEIDNDLDYCEVENMIRRNMEEYKYPNFKEISVFLPVKNIIDIFDDKNYIFEISKFKFSRNNINFIENREILRKTYPPWLEKQELFFDSKDNLWKHHHAVEFNATIAYYNPFDLLKRKSEFYLLYDHIKKLNHDPIVFFKQLLELLNKMHFEHISVQQNILLSKIYTRKSYKHPSSFRDLIQKQYQGLCDMCCIEDNAGNMVIKENIKFEYIMEEDGKIYKDTQNYFVKNVVFYKLKAFEKFFNFYKNNKKKINYKNLTINFFGFKEDNYKIRFAAEEILEEAKLILQKEESLKEIYVKFSNILCKEFFNEIKFKKEHRDFLNKLLKDILVDGNDKYLSKTSYLDPKYQDFYTQNYDSKRSKYNGYNLIHKVFDFTKIDKMLNILPHNVKSTLYS